MTKSHCLLLSILICTLIVAAGYGSVFVMPKVQYFFSGHPAEEAPFVLTQTHIEYAGDTQEVRRGHQHTYAKSRGGDVFEGKVLVDSTIGVTRAMSSIRFADGLLAHTERLSSSKEDTKFSTCLLVRKRDAASKLFDRDPSSDCLRGYNGAPRAEEVLVGEEQLLGFKTFLVESSVPHADGGKMVVVDSLAPALGCEAIKRVTSTLDASGAVVVRVTDAPLTITVGDPPADLFKLAGFQEVQPSELSRQILNFVERQGMKHPKCTGCDTNSKKAAPDQNDERWLAHRAEIEALRASKQ